MSKETEFPTTGEHPPKRNNRLARFIGRFLLRTLGWRFEGQLPNLPKFVIIGGPHTSNWDFILAIIILWIIDLDVAIMGKKEAFRFPMGPVMRWLGTFPVNRQSPVGVIDQVAAEFDEHEQFVLGLSPEGTRKKVTRWKTGFYRIAMKANVPIFPITANFSQRTIYFNPLLMPSGDMENEIALLRTYFDAGRGHNANLG
ncbi:MAG: 1-acyl-sn-glycerol-3-phosphate acyltransferase [Candidatus Promineifilaceae bacterium]